MSFCKFTQNVRFHLWIWMNRLFFVSWQMFMIWLSSMGNLLIVHLLRVFGSCFVFLLTMTTYILQLECRRHTCGTEMMKHMFDMQSGNAIHSPSFIVNCQNSSIHVQIFENEKTEYEHNDTRYMHTPNSLLWAVSVWFISAVYML